MSFNTKENTHIAWSAEMIIMHGGKPHYKCTDPATSLWMEINTKVHSAVSTNEVHENSDRGQAHRTLNSSRQAVQNFSSSFRAHRHQISTTDMAAWSHC